MDLKLDAEELYEVESVMERDSEDLDTAIETITQALEELRGIWEGQDADKFFNNTREFFEKMRGIPMCMRNMGKFMNRANKDLMEKDDEFSKELETEVDERYTGGSSGHYTESTGRGAAVQHIDSGLGKYDSTGGTAQIAEGYYTEAPGGNRKTSKLYAESTGRGDAVQHMDTGLGKFDSVGGSAYMATNGGSR